MVVVRGRARGVLTHVLWGCENGAQEKQEAMKSMKEHNASYWLTQVRIIHQRVHTLRHLSYLCAVPRS